MKYISCKRSTTLGKHPNIGYWGVIELIPQITSTRCAKVCNSKARHSITIGWL